MGSAIRAEIPDDSFYIRLALRNLLPIPQIWVNKYLDRLGPLR